MKIDKHGLPMRGLKAASGDTLNYGDYSPVYVEIFYHVRTGAVWTLYQYNLWRNSWTSYNDPEILKICNTSKHMTMQEIADAIARRVKEVML